MYIDLYSVLCEIEQGPELYETLTQTEIEKMREELATPEILPCLFDVTIPGWLARIELWGKVEIYHKDPENFWGKKKVTKKQFLDKISDDNLNKMFGRWSIKKNGLTKCTFYRDYIDVKGRHRKEQFIIKVKLRPELR